jgi:hypothetical protein
VSDGSTVAVIDGDGVNVKVWVWVCAGVVVEEVTAPESALKSAGSGEAGAPVATAGAQLNIMIAITSSDVTTRYFPRIFFIVPSSAAGQ